jgi:hypothetical protein
MHHDESFCIKLFIDKSSKNGTFKGALHIQWHAWHCMPLKHLKVESLTEEEDQLAALKCC